jgi:hypothetical protein
VEILTDAPVEPPRRAVAVARRKKTPPVIEEISAGGESEEGEVFLEITVEEVNQAANLRKSAGHRGGFGRTVVQRGGVGFVEREIRGLNVHTRFERFQCVVLKSEGARIHVGMVETPDGPPNPMLEMHEREAEPVRGQRAVVTVRYGNPE